MYILSTLTLNADGPTDLRVQEVNIQFRNLSSSLTSLGERVVLAELYRPDGPQAGDLADGAHLNDGGYNKMVTIYFNAIESTSAQGFIQP